MQTVNRLFYLFVRLDHASRVYEQIFMSSLELLERTRKFRLLNRAEQR